MGKRRDDDHEEDALYFQLVWFGVGKVKKVEDDDNGVLITQNIVAKGNEAKYVLEYGPTRSLILDDLTELGTLLFETLVQNNLMFLEYFLENIDMESVPNELKSSKIPSWLQIIGNVNAELDSSKLANLLLLSDDPSEADRIAEKINKHKVTRIRS